MNNNKQTRQQIWMNSRIKTFQDLCLHDIFSSINQISLMYIYSSYRNTVMYILLTIDSNNSLKLHKYLC